MSMRIIQMRIIGILTEGTSRIISVAQAISKIEPNAATDGLNREAVTMVAAR
jgi:hypothetical protein